MLKILLPISILITARKYLQTCIVPQGHIALSSNKDRDILHEGFHIRTPFAEEFFICPKIIVLNGLYVKRIRHLISDPVKLYAFDHLCLRIKDKYERQVLENLRFWSNLPSVIYPCAESNACVPKRDHIRKEAERALENHLSLNMNIEKQMDCAFDDLGFEIVHAKMSEWMDGNSIPATEKIHFKDAPLQYKSWGKNIK